VIYVGYGPRSWCISSEALIWNVRAWLHQISKFGAVGAADDVALNLRSSLLRW